MSDKALEVDGLTFKGIKNLFNIHHSKSAIIKAEEEGRIPRANMVQVGNRKQRIWDYQQISLIGEKYGFLKPPTRPTTISIFSTKGGILKSTIALNIARMHALHNVKTIVIDLDPQGDSSNNLGLDLSEESYDDLSDVDKALETIAGLFDLKSGNANLKDLIQETDIPQLHFIPATSELIPLMDILNSEVKREEWLKENVIKPLQRMGYQLVVIDLAPSWSIFTSNAIAASNLLISPLETKIAHYRNHHSFIETLDKFIKKMRMENELKLLFVPVKNSATRKLSTQIKQYYFNHVPGCSSVSIRESVIGEESIAKRLSVLEYAPNKALTEDVRELLHEINYLISQPVQ